MTSPSAGDAVEYLPSTSQSPILSSVRDVKPTTNTLKATLKSLLDNPKTLSNQECYIGQILKKLDKETSKLFSQALDDARIRHVDLLKLCSEEGFKMSEATMRRHRAKACRCPR